MNYHNTNRNAIFDISFCIILYSSRKQVSNPFSDRSNEHSVCFVLIEKSVDDINGVGIGFVKRL